MMPDAPTQVFVVTHGSYSDYRISSIWLTLEEAQAVASNDGMYDDNIEVWPVGENKRTLGAFSHSGDFDGTTGEPVTPEWDSEDSTLTENRTAILCWDGKNTIGIRVTADTQERADKVYSEVRARVLADISLGLPVEAIATERYARNGWQRIDK